MKFTFGSVCSGIEAVSVAWGDFAKPLWFSEIEQFPCAVLAHHYPDVPNLGDMRTIPERILNQEIPAPDVLVGGTPCQAFSISGKRRSLEDERGNLTLVLIEILEAIDHVRSKDGKAPCVLVWENVPGVLSTKDNAFGCLVGGLVGEFEPLQPPRGKWTGAGYVHSEKRNIAWRILNAKHFGVPQSRRRIFLVASTGERSPAEILFEPFGESIPRPPRAEAVAPTLTASRGRRFNDSEVIISEERGLRWLTPNECERLMGFPVGYTRIPYRNKTAENCPDSHRYKAIGNSMAVPVMRWIGNRLFTSDSN
nr:MAG TPA: Cytosine specific methyltransferase [Caudoviricetes sp.]